MKPLFALLSCLTLGALPLPGTNPDIETVLQPVNLVGQSRAGCIPLAPAVCYANYRYGIHKMISAPHPFLGGAREWKRGTESNSNLASVFGILVRPTNGTLVPYEPVEIIVKDWDIPPYSPHNRSEVLAATIHCLLLSCHASADHPLDLRIVTENRDDQKWAKPFEKKYFRLPGKDGKPVTPTPVGKTFIKTDGFGISYVISPRENPEHKLPEATPAILPFNYDSDGKPTHLIPVWTATGFPDPFQALATPRGHFYNVFTGQRFSLENNPLLTDKNTLSIWSKIEENQVEVVLGFTGQSLHSLTPAIASAAIMARLHHDKPLSITLDPLVNDSETIRTLLKVPGWHPSKRAKRTAATSLFDYDPETISFRKGQFPDEMMIRSFATGPLYVSKPSE